MAREEKPAPAGADIQTIWRVLEGFAWATVAAQVLSTALSLFTSGRTFLVPALAVGGGLVVLRAIILVGVRERGMWALWCGMAMGALTVLTMPILLRAHVSGDFGVIEVTPAAAIMGWVTVLVNVLFLIGACWVLISERRAK